MRRLSGLESARIHNFLQKIMQEIRRNLLHDFQIFNL